MIAPQILAEDFSRFAHMDRHRVRESLPWIISVLRWYGVDDVPQWSRLLDKRTADEQRKIDRTRSIDELYQQLSLVVGTGDRARYDTTLTALRALQAEEVEELERHRDRPPTPEEIRSEFAEAKRLLTAP